MFHDLTLAAASAEGALLPAPPRLLLHVVAAVLTAGAVLLGVRRHQPVQHLPWRLVAAGLACSAGGSLVVVAQLQLTGGLVPSYGQLLQGAAYVLLLLGLHRFAAARDGAGWVDAWAWTVGALLVVWQLLLEPWLAREGLPVSVRVAAVGFPLLDLGLVLVLVRLLSSGTGRTPAFRLLCAGTLLTVVGDVVASLQALHGGPVPALALDTAHLVTYALVVVAALHPSMADVAAPPRAEPVLGSERRLLSLALPVLLAPALLVVQLATGQLRGEVRQGLVIAGCATLLFGLCVLRGLGLLRAAARTEVQLRQRQDQLVTALAEREELSEALRRRADSDPLTGLANREAFVDAVSRELATRRAISVAFLDLDDFKGVNDTLGHEAGDVLLLEVAARLRAAVPASAVVARLGGDEFAVLLQGDPGRFGDLLLQALAPPARLGVRELRLDASIGFARSTGTDGQGTSDLLRTADLAMYAAKQSGGRRWQVYRPEMGDAVQRRVDLRARLQRGLARGEVAPHFQPLVDLRTGELLGFEALARWQPTAATGDPAPEVHATTGWVGLAEETGLVVDVDLLVLRSAAEALTGWRSRGAAAQALHLAVNVSGRTLQEPGIEDRVLQVLRDTGLPADRLLVEVTEGVLLVDDAVGGRLQRLRAAGVRIALDDFGTGWSSLSYLRRFPVDVLKIDASFTASLGEGEGGDAVASAVLHLARALGLDVVAEGVETDAQAARLRELGCVVAQGWLYGAAQPSGVAGDVVTAGRLGPQLAALQDAARRAAQRLPEPRPRDLRQLAATA